MKIFKVKEDCFCEGYLSELAASSRSGLIEMKLNQGDEVQFVDEWSGLDETYFRVQKGNKKYDILPKYLEEA